MACSVYTPLQIHACPTNLHNTKSFEHTQDTHTHYAKTGYLLLPVWQMLTTRRLAQRSTEVVRPRQALLAAPSVRAGHTSQFYEMLPNRLCQQTFQAWAAELEWLTTQVRMQQPVGTPVCLMLLTRAYGNVWHDSVFISKVYQGSLPWLSSALKLTLKGCKEVFYQIKKIFWK